VASTGYNIIRYKSINQILNAKKLRLGTTVNPISFFYYKNGYAGFEYEIAKYISKKLDIELEVIPVSNDSILYTMLQSGEIDLAANNYLSLNHSYPSSFSYTAPYFQSNLIAISYNKDSIQNNIYKRIKASKIILPTSDMEHIPYQKMKTYYSTNLNIFLDDTSSSFELMQHLINQDSVTLITWDYLFKLSNLDQLKNVQTHKINMACKMSFLTAHDNHTLLDTVNSLIYSLLQTKKYQNITNKYFTNNQLLTVVEPAVEKNTNRKIKKYKKGAISKYDELLKLYCKPYHLDWKLVAAIIFKESNFNPDVESSYGASGLMQLMPETGKRFGADNLFDPAQNIKAGTAYLNYLKSYWSKKVNDSTEVMYFVIASYNSGQGHIIDAQNLAKKYNANPNVWYNNVEFYLSLLSEPKYYKDRDCKLGYCKATETLNFVRNVTEKHQFYKAGVK
jgi:membrane-bound lytic murein transglycosylase F